MANKGSQASSERSRVRFMLVDFEGSSEDLHQLAATFANAVKATQPVVMALPSSQSGAISSAASATALLQHPGSVGQPNGVLVSEPESEAEPVVASRPQNGSKKRKTYRNPTVLADLNLTDGPKPFKTFHDEKAPKTHSIRYLVIAHWLKENRGIEEVGADHVYTCYRFLGLTVPEDVLSIFRAVKGQGWVHVGSKNGLFKINHVGVNQLTQSGGAD